MKSLYNIDISDVMQFVSTQLKIPPTSKVKIEYDDDMGRLLSISKINDSLEISPPPFSIMYIEPLNETEPFELSVRANGQTTTLPVNSHRLSP